MSSVHHPAPKPKMPLNKKKLIMAGATAATLATLANIGAIKEKRMQNSQMPQQVQSLSRLEILQDAARKTGLTPGQIRGIQLPPEKTRQPVSPQPKDRKHSSAGKVAVATGLAGATIGAGLGYGLARRRRTSRQETARGDTGRQTSATMPEAHGTIPHEVGGGTHPEPVKEPAPQAHHETAAEHRSQNAGAGHAQGQPRKGLFKRTFATIRDFFKA